MKRTTGLLGRRFTSSHARTSLVTAFARTTFTGQRSCTSGASVLRSINAGEKRFKFYHFTSIGLAVLLPVGLLSSPSSLSTPIDWALAFLLPAHAHIGARNILLDYVPRNLQITSIWLLRVTTFLAFLGLLKINETCGLLEGAKELWRATPSKKSNEK